MYRYCLRDAGNEKSGIGVQEVDDIGDETGTSSMWIVLRTNASQATTRGRLEADLSD